MELLENSSPEDGKIKYPWDEWVEASLKGYALKLIKGEDFTCKVESLKVYARTVARERGLKLTTSTKSSNEIHIQFYRPE